MSFSKGIFPEKLKIVKVIPLHKGGSTQDLNNFRPISLLSIFDKIIEKIIHKKLYHSLDLHLKINLVLGKIIQLLMLLWKSLKK